MSMCCNFARAVAARSNNNNSNTSNSNNILYSSQREIKAVVRRTYLNKSKS